MDEVGKLSDALPLSDAPIVHVEVCLQPCSTALPKDVKDFVDQFLMQVHTVYGDTSFNHFESQFLQENVKTISVCDTELIMERKAIDLHNCKLAIHVYQLHEDGPGNEELEDDISAASHWLLPSAEFEGVWDSLVFDSGVKSQVAPTSFPQQCHCGAGVTMIGHELAHEMDCSICHYFPFHPDCHAGPPGTGKTSLCKALAQKLCVRLSDRYSYGQMIEINSHSLFSKWFSESGKLVMKMFQKIQELIDDTDAFVCVLIDEVESLTAARKAAMQGQEPSDAIRVVNALLTQIDQIKRYPNVMILTTSNVTGAIDLAFVDRADIKQYIGLPSVNAIYTIYHSCINELMRTGIVTPTQQIIDLRGLEVLRFVHNDATQLSLELREIARKSHGLSGRTLRKLPFLAHAMFLESSTATLQQFLKALHLTVERQFQERQNLENE